LSFLVLTIFVQGNYYADAVKLNDLGMNEFSNFTNLDQLKKF